ncbi:hypothetical protein BO79DRAFT_253488 [Aspergillus costaricaensis CBS 115574]|uniref:Uncharacterized protein n=1 Tax=Aspergillus costaricaensis CBS 115574 TaxID=1448317 RepID=A0ACD1IIJ2_9EURO|nr:hypothetical protein BO79DRAFT_253488 [Aspergillus costaricaensis CBS 115574]RAK90072.1 hypothetical protein BO79DRAFT_253488 [Aspergillus costaricaensis CBS 115574]
MNCHNNVSEGMTISGGWTYVTHFGDQAVSRLSYLPAPTYQIAQELGTYACNKPGPILNGDNATAVMTIRECPSLESPEIELPCKSNTDTEFLTLEHAEASYTDRIRGAHIPAPDSASVPAPTLTIPGWRLRPVPRPKAGHRLYPGHSDRPT